VATTDDHEVDNNYAGGIPDDDQSPEDFLLRRAAAYQTFYEFLPLRASSMPVGPDMPLYRRLQFGSLMEMNVLDTRQYRSDQPCGDRVKPTCAEHFDPDRSMLGSSQRNWLFNGFGESESRWNVIAQQVLVASLRYRNDEGDQLWSMDKWDGYPADRQRLIDAMADSGVPNPVVLTGDIHATEFACTSLSSGGNGVAESRIGAAALAGNSHFDFYNSQRGYVVVGLTPDEWRSTYRIVPEVETRGGAVETAATFVVENGNPAAQRV